MGRTRSSMGKMLTSNLEVMTADSAGLY